MMKILRLWFVAALACAVTFSPACVTPADDEAAAPGAATRHALGATAPAPAEPGPGAMHDDPVAALVAALQAQVVLAPALGEPAWGEATLEHVDDGDFDVLVVPLGTGRMLAARVDPSRGGTTFRTAIVDYAIDPATGEWGVIALHEIDGTARALPTDDAGRAAFGCYSDCVTVAIALCTPACPFTINPPGCVAACAAAAAVACGVHCLFSWLWS